MPGGDDFFLVGKRPMTEAEATCRAIFLDFDGSHPRPVAYCAAPSEAKLNSDSIERILATLNEVFSDREIRFFSAPPECSYHTIYVNDPPRESAPTDAVDVEATEVVAGQEKPKPAAEPKPAADGGFERDLVDRIAAEAERLLKTKGGD